MVISEKYPTSFALWRSVNNVAVRREAKNPHMMSNPRELATVGSSALVKPPLNASNSSSVIPPALLEDALKGD
jgi:hypothetical protein